jgi:tellurite methyltransferase
MSISEHNILLPPVDVVRDLDQYAGAPDGRTAFDAGCGSGRNSLFLAQQGYDVLGVSNDPAEIQLATRRAAALGTVAGRCTFQVADLQSMTIHGNYDLMLNNEVWHLMPRPAAADLLRRQRLHTKNGGLHVVSGYLWQSGLSSQNNVTHCLRPDELYDTYDRAGWKVLHYDEDIKPLQYIDGREIMSSRARLVARRQQSQARPAIIDMAA